MPLLQHGKKGVGDLLELHHENRRMGRVLHTFIRRGHLQTLHHNARRARRIDLSQERRGRYALDDVEAVDVVREGQAVRYDSRFYPDGISAGSIDVCGMIGATAAIPRALPSLSAR